MTGDNGAGVGLQNPLFVVFHISRGSKAFALYTSSCDEVEVTLRCSPEETIERVDQASRSSVRDFLKAVSHVAC